MNRKQCWLWLGLALLVGAQHVHAQATDVARVAEFREERELVQRLEKEIPRMRAMAFDWGAWYRLSYTKYDDFPIDREVTDHDVRLWGNFSIGDIHQFYVRGRVTYAYWAHGDDPSGRDHDIIGPNLDLGWYRLSLSRAAKAYLNQQWPLDVELKLGRQYYEVGYGGVLSQVLDGVTLDLDHHYFHARFFAAKHRSSNENLDTSAPGFKRDKRSFLAFEASLKNVVPRHELYVYGVFVNDGNSYNGAPAGQGFGYDPNYLGVGLIGRPIPRLRYWAEFIYESGKSHTAGSLRSEDIKAHALVAGAEYYCQSFPTRPRFEVEYGIGSGDSDRASPTATTMGNTPFTDDDGFLAYGYHDTGVAFGARLANLKVLRATAAFRPLEFWECAKNLELGASYYWFDKDKSAGGISDFRAGLASKDLGTELDLFLNWRITSDLLWTVRWGQFKPGAAYGNRSDREYVLTSITYSF